MPTSSKPYDFLHLNATVIHYIVPVSCHKQTPHPLSVPLIYEVTLYSFSVIPFFPIMTQKRRNRKNWEKVKKYQEYINANPS